MRTIPRYVAGRAALVAGVVALAAVATGCTQAAERDSASGVSVVVSSYPLEEAVLAVGGDRVLVQNLTPPGVEPHDLELAASAMEALGTADLVVYLGGDFQSAVQDALGDVPVERKLDALSVAGSPADGPVDPHLWLDPSTYASVVRAVGEALARIDPEGSQAYQGAADAFVGRLDDLDAQMREGLARCDSRLLVTGHEAFAYLAQAYGLEGVGISGLSPEAEPGPERLADIRELVTSRGVTTVFAEAQLPRDVVDLIGSETGAEVAVLDPLETLTEEQRAAGEDYASVMQANLSVLREGLGCD